MRKKRSWVVWCIVVALAVLALAVPWLQAQSKGPGGKDTYKGECRVVDETGENIATITQAQVQKTYDAGVLVKVTCRGTLDTYDPALVPTSWSGSNQPPSVLFTCDTDGYSTFDWYETINRKGRVSLTCNFW